MQITITTDLNNNANLIRSEAVSNGRKLRHFFGDPLVNDDSSFKHGNEMILIPNSTQHYWTWQVRNPINTYNATFYIGDYAHWHDTLHGEKGVLDLDFYPLKYNMAKAKKHWAVTKDMLRCFEYWMGPYPFYEDGYKLVEAPYLGMEHQSAVAYGNEYKMGYRGKDRSGTGVGLSFDFIIVHESGHEWFGNNITARDVADNWLHEGFTSYSETLFAEWIKGKDSAFAYTTGKWALIKNDRPLIGDYGVHKEGSGDIYEKGAAVVHMIRLMINNDSTFRQLLRGLNRDFYHKIVTSKEVEEYISRFVGRDLKAFFDVYLRSTNIPTLTCTTVVKDRKIHFEWKDANPLFKAPIAISRDAGKTYKILQSPDEMTYDTYLVRRDLRVKAVGLYKVEEKQ